MQLGRTIIGAVIGAAIGIAVMAAVYIAFKLDSAWLALPVAILTGLGVRMMVSTSGHASYLRGAITGLLALGAYLLGWSVMATYAQQTAARASQSTRVEQPAEPGDKAEGAEAAEGAEPVEAPKEVAMPVASKSSGARASKAGVPKGFSTLDYIVLCAAGLIAYELGRGTAGPKQVVEVEETITEVPAGTHPDA